MSEIKMKRILELPFDVFSYVAEDLPGRSPLDSALSGFARGASCGKQDRTISQT